MSMLFCPRFSCPPFICCPEILFSFHVACYANGSLYLMGVSTFVGLGSSAQNSVFIVGLGP